MSYSPQQQVAVIHHSYVPTSGNHEVVKKEIQQESAYMTAAGRGAGKHIISNYFNFTTTFLQIFKM